MLNILYLIKKIIKLTIAFCLFYTGVLHFLLYKKFKNKSIVVMYHRVLLKEQIQKTNSHEAIVVSDKTFKKQLKFLNKHFKIITPSEFSQTMNSNGSFDSRTCLITFDDGWLDNYDNALPILRKYKFPAVIFLSTNFIGTNSVFWQERFKGLFINLINQEDVKTKAKYKDLLTRFNIKSGTEINKKNVTNLISTIQTYLKTLTVEERNKKIKYLSEIVEAEPNTIDSFMNWNHVLNMEKNGIEFQPHGANHKILTTLTKSELENEVKDSIKKIEKKLSKTPYLFAYPNGNYNVDAISILRDNKIECAFTTKPGEIDTSSNKYEINRFNISENNSKNLPLFMTSLLRIF